MSRDPYYRQGDALADGCGTILIWFAALVVIGFAGLSVWLFVGAKP